jgi:hypothetical protein
MAKKGLLSGMQPSSLTDTRNGDSSDARVCFDPETVGEARGHGHRLVQNCHHGLVPGPHETASKPRHPAYPKSADGPVLGSRRHISRPMHGPAQSPGTAPHARRAGWDQSSICLVETVIVILAIPVSSAKP